jgi:hypothetical protein
VCTFKRCLIRLLASWRLNPTAASWSAAIRVLMPGGHQTRAFGPAVAAHVAPGSRPVSLSVTDPPHFRFAGAHRRRDRDLGRQADGPPGLDHHCQEVRPVDLLKAAPRRGKCQRRLRTPPTAVRRPYCREHDRMQSRLDKAMRRNQI